MQGNIRAEYTAAADQFFRAGDAGQSRGAEHIRLREKGGLFRLGPLVPRPGAGVIVRVQVVSTSDDLRFLI